ncbi:MAG TPA: hypothetical protein PKK06_03730 [Phycisphaerae bacterium]|nr:hypothetical protein [Phycisphaerae bacterium]HNU45389.1 hypothetical protein [Phycisphaerae bacterium]
MCRVAVVITLWTLLGAPALCISGMGGVCCGEGFIVSGEAGPPEAGCRDHDCDDRHTPPVERRRQHNEDTCPLVCGRPVPVPLDRSAPRVPDLSLLSLPLSEPGEVGDDGVTPIRPGKPSAAGAPGHETTSLPLLI